MEDTLEDSQAEEQHGFRTRQRIEEHLLTANLCLQKTSIFALDPEDRQLRGNVPFMYTQLFFTCALHGPPSGIQVSLFTHSLLLSCCAEHGLQA